MIRSSCWRIFRGLLASFLVAALLVSTPGSVWAGGVTWTARSSAVPYSVRWNDVTYGNGLFVAVAGTVGTNRVMTSPDGITWAPQSAAENNNWYSVTYGDDLFVAVGTIAAAGTGVMTSPDGITWARRDHPLGQPNDWRSVTYGNDLFVAVSDSGTKRVMTSPDGITWTARDHPALASNNWYSVTYGNDLFVAVARSGNKRVMTSPDGITWTARDHPVGEDNEWFSVTYGNGLFVAVAADSEGENRVMTSPDGITWTARAHPAGEDNYWRAVTYGNGLFVAVAANGTNRVMTSPDGITWTARSAAEANSWYDVTYGDGLFVAVAWSGTNRVMTSNAPGFSLSTTTATVSETGTTATFTVVLDAQPVSDVVFSVVSADTGEATVDKATLTFTNADWNSPQTVTVTGVDDGVVDGDQATAITVAVVDASSDDPYDAQADQSVTATTTHDDIPPPPPGVRDFCATSGTIWANPFSDAAHSNTSFHADVGCVYNSGVMRGTTTTTLSPDDTATREQVAVFIQRVMAISGGLCTSRVPPWGDLASTSFAIGEISCLYGSGLINGTTTTTFSPAAPVTRAETAALVARLYRWLSTNDCPTDTPPFTDTTGNWASTDIACVYGLGIDTGTTATTFSPGDTLTRADMATILARTIRALL